MVLPTLIIVGPDPTSTRTVIGNRANQKGMVMVDGLNMVMVDGVWRVIRMGWKLTTVANPVPRLSQIHVDED